MLEKLQKELLEMANEEGAIIKKRYFKSLEEGDVFIGVSNPDVQRVFKKYEKSLVLNDIAELLKNEVHEVRYGALVLLVRLYERKKNIFERQNILEFYLEHSKYINNWDLVDCSCYKILGHYSFETKTVDFLEKLIESKSLWEKRMTIVSTLYHIKEGDFRLALKFSEKEFKNKEDLIQKAIGWMLKEAWSRGGEELVESFIIENYSQMTRTCLRYAIEKMPEKQRKRFLKMEVF
jgi:3-methyladenine DNA glycosylase AlkD